MRDVETSAGEPQPAPPNPQTPGIIIWNDMREPFYSEEKYKGVDEVIADQHASVRATCAPRKRVVTPSAGGELGVQQ